MFARIDRRRKLPVTIILRALGYTEEQMLDMFFDKNTYHLSKNKIEFELIPARLRGETATFTIKVGDEVIVEEGRRVTARHVRQLEQKNVTRLEVPKEYLIGKILAHDVFNTETGEILAKANEILTVAVVDKLIEAGIEQVRVLYVNDLDRGPYISDTLRIDPTRTRLEALVEIYRMMRPGEPPTKDAAENLFQNLFFNPERYDLSAVGRMKFNRRVHRDAITGPGILYDTRTSRSARMSSRRSWCEAVTARARTSSPSSRSCATSATATARSTTSITWATAACVRSAKWRRTPSASASCASSAP